MKFAIVLPTRQSVTACPNLRATDLAVRQDLASKMAQKDPCEGNPNISVTTYTSPDGKTAKIYK